jgi:glyoxylase-like metal-dependent hydrolase (beta-lactamase superfamily II)
VAAALVNKGSTLDEQKKPDEAIAAYDEVATRFGKAEEPELKEQVARALVGKGVTLNEQRRPREAIATWDEVIRRLANAESHRLRPFLGWSLAYKGYVQGRAGNVGEAKRTFRRARQVLPKDEFVQQLAAASISTSKDRVYAGSRKRATETISVYIEALLEQFKPDQQNEFFTKMREREQRTQDFLADTSRFVSDGGSRALLLDLREWNSYTPLVPDQHEVDRGGGYFIRYKNQGIVIDPGFDFIKNFGDADGRVCDIDHVVITHAHNDHTQDFESLLSLVHQHNRKHKDKIKRIHLYLSHGAARKCSGYVPLRDVEYIQTIDILNQGRRDNPQTIHLHGLLGARLTVLRAYHDDTITLDYSVGLGFEFDFGGTTRTVVFTGDTGLFPPKRGVGGKPTLREDDEPVLDIDMEGSKALYNEYPERFRRPDLLVPHLGSIKKYEFTKLESLPPAQEQANTPLLFYPNHLGIRGLIILLDKLRPKVAIISEFGEELKDVRFKLVEGISQLLEKRRAPKSV